MILKNRWIQICLIISPRSTLLSSISPCAPLTQRLLPQPPSLCLDDPEAWFWPGAVAAGVTCAGRAWLFVLSAAVISQTPRGLGVCERCAAGAEALRLTRPPYSILTFDTLMSRISAGTCLPRAPSTHLRWESYLSAAFPPGTQHSNANRRLLKVIVRPQPLKKSGTSQRHFENAVQKTELHIQPLGRLRHQL